MPNEAFGRLNVKTAPFYLAFRNLSSIDSNHKKIRVCVFQNKSGQVDKYRDEKHKIQKLFYRNCHSLNLANVEIQQKTELFFWRVFQEENNKKIYNSNFSVNCEI